MVGGAGGELADVWREENTGDVFVVSLELGDWHELGYISRLEHTPNVDVSLCICISPMSFRRTVGGTHGVVPSHQHTTVGRNAHTADRDVVFGNQLVSALILSQIPDANVSCLVAANQFSLVGMDHYIVDRRVVLIIALNLACASIPNLDGSVF